MLKNIPGILIRLHYSDAHAAILLISDEFHFILDRSAWMINKGKIPELGSGNILHDVRYLVSGVAFDKLGYIRSQHFRHGFEFIC